MLYIDKGKQGVLADKDELLKKLDSLIRDKIEGKDINEIEIPTKSIKLEEIDIEKIRNEIYKEAKDASYNEETSTLYTHVKGVDFKIGMDEAKELLKEEKEEYQIPLEITLPDITTEKLGEEAFPDQLASFTTKYDANNKNRATNVELATAAVDGTVILPGEIFSFNKTVGPRTKAKGYELAAAYSATGVVDSYGGGVCQVSTTIYNSALYANMEIVQRYNHNFIVSYVDPGRDATVSYGAVDFQFRNTRNYAIKLKTKALNGIVTIEIWGIKEDDDCEIILTSETTDVIPPKVNYIYDSSLGKDEEVVKSEGADGKKSKAYKIVKKDGAIISKTILSEDSYNPMTRIIRTGDRTKK